MTATITNLADVRPRPRTIAIGQFDGVHLGHRDVVANADTVLTFDPHPMAVLRPGDAPPLLMDNQQKAKILGELGVLEMVLIPFDMTFSSMSPEAFIESVLVESLDARQIRIGENFRFGSKAAGTPELLQADQRFTTTVVQLRKTGEQIVSSTLIRQLVANGEVAKANELLGSPLSYSGIVQEGEKRGRELGFRTANLEPNTERVSPPFGVYAGVAVTEDEKRHRAAISIGVRPQFETKLGVLIEAHLLDFDGDLYGQRITIEFHQHLRPELEFKSVEDLIVAIEQDVSDTKRLVKL